MSSTGATARAGPRLEMEVAQGVVPAGCFGNGGGYESRGGCPMDVGHRVRNRQPLGGVERASATSPAQNDECALALAHRSADGGWQDGAASV